METPLSLVLKQNMMRGPVLCLDFTDIYSEARICIPAAALLQFGLTQCLKYLLSRYVSVQLLNIKPPKNPKSGEKTYGL